VAAGGAAARVSGLGHYQDQPTGQGTSI